MIYLVEGIDKSGKTTFINHFSKSQQINSYRKTPPVDLNKTEYHSFFKGVGYATLEIFSSLKDDVLIDRSFISDWVYSNRINLKYNLSIWLNWENRFLHSNISILYFELPFSVFKKRMEANPDPYMSISEYERFTFLYEQYFKKTTFPIIRIPGNIEYAKQKAILDLKSISI